MDIATGDIDPVYWAINRAVREISPAFAIKFCVGMLVYYHTGTAAVAADYDGADFWEYLSSIYDSAPRASERRHFRGVAGKQALADMRRFSPDPVRFFDKFPLAYNGVVQVCTKDLTQFGPYFQLKVCDYINALDLVWTDSKYVGLAKNLPSLPAKAATMLQPGLTTPDAFNAACTRIFKLGLLAPPKFLVPVGPAEVETILCDWKRAKYGSHWIGDDVLDKRTSLLDYSENANKLASFMPPTITKGLFKVEL